ncbi:BRO-F [Alphabaculovirus myunipunctae]|uniref:BRO-F n=1 Tax=Mythimna unipuncta nucleopolyhedrovirus TaxID=447897 RepID=A0A2K9VSC7_9ABAC|nr:BRO-F [Mythimna unipuncta nucleopolyhedrovirus]AUV65346.1 BRO-F [Mythimna unipuncta nucleopolyhedrovirus]
MLKIGLFRFGDQEFELRYIVDGDKNNVMFVGCDIAAVLKYEDRDKAIRKHVDEKYRAMFEQPRRFGGVGCRQVVRQGDPLYLHPKTWLITKAGVIQLIMKSKLPYAVEMQEWLLEEVIPQVLCTGKYHPAVVAATSAAEESMSMYRNFQIMCQRKDEQLQRLTGQMQKMVESKDQAIDRIMNDMNRMYAGFQYTIRQKDDQITKMIDRMVDLSCRAVQYPVDANKMPMLCIARSGNTFHAIAGQRPYVEQQKRRFFDADIVVESKRPNPTLDWNNVVHEANVSFDKQRVKRFKRTLSFESGYDADKFKNTLQIMLSSNR